MEGHVMYILIQVSLLSTFDILYQIIPCYGGSPVLQRMVSTQTTTTCLVILTNDVPRDKIPPLHCTPALL